MWACAKGHRETAILLYRWNHTALNVRNLSAQTATDCARSNKHEELAQEMERLEAAREKNNMTLIGKALNNMTLIGKALNNMTLIGKALNNMTLIGKALNLCSVGISQVSLVKMETHS